MSFETTSSQSCPYLNFDWDIQFEATDGNACVYDYRDVLLGHSRVIAAKKHQGKMSYYLILASLQSADMLFACICSPMLALSCNRHQNRSIDQQR